MGQFPVKGWYSYSSSGAYRPILPEAFWLYPNLVWGAGVFTPDLTLNDTSPKLNAPSASRLVGP